MSNTMLPALVEQFGKPPVIHELPVPLAGAGQILVKTEACGIRQTDLRAANGDLSMRPVLPFIPGHEGIGVVTAVGAGFAEGGEWDRVGVPRRYSACRHANTACRPTKPYVQKRSSVDTQTIGGFAEYVVAGSATSRIFPRARQRAMLRQ